MRTHGEAGLWFGVLGGPVAWVTQLVLTYSLEEWFACSPATTDRGEVFGLGVTTVAVLITAILTVVAVASGLVALGCYRKLQNNGADEIRSRARWMAVAGMMNSVLYVIIILASFGPPALLGVCEVTP